MKQNKELIKNITSLNNKINTYKKYGMDADDLTELFVNVENFDPSLLNKSGTISKSPTKWNKYIEDVLKKDNSLSEDELVNSLIEDLDNKLLSMKDLKKETNTTTERAAVKEYLAKKEIDDILSEFRKQYYDIVTAIAAKDNISMDEAEATLYRATNSIYAKGNTADLVERLSNWGSEFRKIEKGKESTMTYRQAVNELKKFSKGLYRAKAAVRKNEGGKH